MSHASLRRPRVAAPSARADDELDNGGVDVSGDDDEQQQQHDDDDAMELVASPIAHRTRSRSVSPNTTRTTRTTTKVETITFPQPTTKPAPSLSNTAPAPPQPLQPAYQPPVPSSSSVVFPLVTKRRLRFWIPLLVSLLLTALLLYVRAPRPLHSPSRWTQPHSRHLSHDELSAHGRDSRQRREAVHNPTQRTEYDQYAAHQDDKEEMAKERARRLINEVHGVAAQIKQEEGADTDARLQPHYEPLKNAHPSAKDIVRERKERGDIAEDGWALRVADWLGFGPYMRLEKREDGIHHVRGDDDHDTDKYDYMRGAAASKGKKSVHKDQEGTAGAAEEGAAEEEAHSHVNSMLTYLRELEERFSGHVDAIKQRITQKTVPPYKQIRADDKQPSTPPPATSSADDDSVPVQFISTSPDHPLLDPLHSILASVESLIARPVTPPSPPPAVSYWARLMDAVFPSSVSDEARKVYDIARYEASKEAARVRRAMTAQYDKVRSELRSIGEEVRGGTSEPLELYEQYNPEPVDTTEIVEATAHTKEK